MYHWYRYTFTGLAHGPLDETRTNNGRPSSKWNVLNWRRARSWDWLLCLGVDLLSWGVSVPMRNAKKFNNQKQDLDGHSFSSKLEAAVYLILKSRMVAGEIAEIQVQDHVLVCGPHMHTCNSKCKIEYIADFKCTRPSGALFWVEAKGFANEKWPLKRRLWMHYGPGDLEIYMGSYQRPFLKETINAKLYA